jgi:hypothetical protein
VPIVDRCQQLPVKHARGILLVLFIAATTVELPGLLVFIPNR